MVNVTGANAGAQEAINRVLESPEGSSVEEDLQHMFCSHPDHSCWPKINITFGPTNAAEGGSVDPNDDTFLPNPLPQSEEAAWKQFTYKVTIGPQINVPGTLSHGVWPGGNPDNDCILYNFADDPVSEQATTIYHELLHIWFMNTGQTTKTGHDNDPTSCGSYDPGFMQKLKYFFGDMDNRRQCPKSVSSPASSPAPQTHH